MMMMTMETGNKRFGKSTLLAKRHRHTLTQGHTPCLKSFIRILDDIHSRQLMQTGNDKHDGKRRQQQQQQLITTGERTSNHATPQLDLIRSV